MVETELVCIELGREIDRLKGEGFRLDLIYPADEPHTAVLSRDGDTIRVTSRPGEGLPSRVAVGERDVLREPVIADKRDDRRRSGKGHDPER